MKEDSIISSLIGLIGACESNPKTSNTDNLIIKALAFPFIDPEYDTQKLQDMVNEIYFEKNAVAPACAQCTSPCGNTSDYDMNRIYTAENEICEIKLQILSELQKLAFHIYNHKSEVESEIEIPFLYKALSFVSCDREKSILLEILTEAKTLSSKNTNQK